MSRTNNQRNVLRKRYSGGLTHIYLVTGFCLLLSWCNEVLAQAADPRPLIDEALEKLDATNLDDDWYFTMEVIEKDELRIVHSDPLRDKYERRQLITVNGAPPDEQQLEKFHDAELERIDGEDPERRVTAISLTVERYS